MVTYSLSLSWKKFERFQGIPTFALKPQGKECSDCNSLAESMENNKKVTGASYAWILPTHISCLAHHNLMGFDKRMYLRLTSIYVPIYLNDEWKYFYYWRNHLELLNWDNFRDSHSESQELILKAPSYVQAYLVERKKRQQGQRSQRNLPCHCPHHQLFYQGCPTAQGLDCPSI